MLACEKEGRGHMRERDGLTSRTRICCRREKLMMVGSSRACWRWSRADRAPADTHRTA